MQFIGWICSHRKIFANPLLKKAEWFRAWMWLCAEAAYEDKCQRAGRGIVNLRRGQLLATIRGLAEAWGWPKTNVARFLTRLKQEGMITIEKVGPLHGTPTGTDPACRESIITICNYSKYNDLPRPGNCDAGQPAGQKSGRRGSQRSDSSGELATQQDNHTTRLKLGRESVRTVRKRTRPRHGQIKGDLVFIYHGTSDWSDYAADYKSVRGKEPLSSTYDDGKGRWFKIGGELVSAQSNRA